MIAEDKMEEKVSYSLRSYAGWWSLVTPCHACNDLSGEYYSASAQRCVVSKCHVAFNIHLPAPLDLARPVIEVERYILLIYTT